MESRNITTDDEQGIIFALKRRDRVLRVRLTPPDTSLLVKFIAVMDEEYPILEYLIIIPRTGDASTIWIFPETLQAPHLRLLRLRGFSIPMGSQLLTTAVSLVTLSLVMLHPSTYIHPNTLLQCISHMPQLKTLSIYFKFPIPSRNVERQLTHMPIIEPVTLPNLRHFQFHGVSTYLDALLYRIAIPRLEKLHIDFFNQSRFSIPLTAVAENFRLDSANLRFTDSQVDATVHPHGKPKMYAFAIVVLCCHLDWQVSFAAQISNSLNQIFSAVEHLNLVHNVHRRSSEEHNQVDRAEWRRLLRPLRNVKTLQIARGLVADLSRCLKLEDGELPLELLPELQELTYSRTGNAGDGFTPFIDARQNAGRPVKLVRR
jgi:hypothetical protein